MSILKAAVAALAVASATPASAASIYTLTFFASGTGTNSVFSMPDTFFNAATLTMSIVVDDGGTGGTGGDSLISHAAGAKADGIGFSSGAPSPFAVPNTITSGTACFSNPSIALPLGTIAVDPSCGSLNYRSFYSRASTTFTGTITGLSITRGGTDTGFSFVSAIPEPSTWALMLAGFGMVGYALRRRRVAYA